MPSISTSYDSAHMRVSDSDLFVIRLDASVELQVARRDRRRPPMRAAELLRQTLEAGREAA